MMNTDIEKKVILEGQYEDVVQIKEHYYLVSKKNKIAFSRIKIIFFSNGNFC